MMTLWANNQPIDNCTSPRPNTAEWSTIITATSWCGKWLISWCVADTLLRLAQQLAKSSREGPSGAPNVYMHARVRLSFFRFNTSFSRSAYTAPHRLSVSSYRSTAIPYTLHNFLLHHYTLRNGIISTLSTSAVDNKRKHTFLVPLYKNSGKNRPWVPRIRGSQMKRHWLEVRDACLPFQPTKMIFYEQPKSKTFNWKDLSLLHTWGT